MNDDELIEALRRTLHSQASSVRPSPSTAPRPKLRRAKAASPRRRVLLLASVSTALAAATAAIVLAVAQNPRPSSSVFVTTPPPGPNTTAVTPTTPPATTPTPTTVPLQPVPTGFQALSITFVSPRTGWALGSVPCAAGDCVSVARTSDGGKQWGAVGAPAATLSTADLALSQAVNIRFGDGYNGWIVIGGPGGTSSQLWSSHDGGNTWNSVPNPGGSNASIFDVESSYDMAYLVANTPGTGVDRIYSTPVEADTWAPSTVTIPAGGGPEPSAQVVLFGPNGWITAVNRIVTGGARLGPTGWTGWTAPCLKANGVAQVAAASASDLVATCQEGNFGTPEPGTAAGTEWLYTSSDGGTSFTPVGSIPVQSPPSLAVAAGRPETIVAANGNKLVATFDGGKSWTTVAGSAGGSMFTFVGFTNATQGVAIEQTLGSTTAAALMTYDGGKTWTTVSF